MSQFRTPLKKARGLGSAKGGSEHFAHQRLTAAALVLLGVWFVVLVLSLLGADYASAIVTISKPWNAALLVGFLVAMFWHAQLGLQVIVEDYVQSAPLALAMQVPIKFIASLGAIISVLAVARIALTN